MAHAVSFGEWMAVAAFAGGGLFVAVLLRLVVGAIAARRARGKSDLDDVLIAVLRSLLPAAALIVGLWLAVEQLPLRRNWRGVSIHVLVAVAILVATLVLARLTVAATRSFAQGRAGVAPSTALFANIVRIVVLAVGLLVLLQSLGVSITPLLTALGVGGLAVALALQDTLTNLFAGIHILASKKIEPGDYIQMSTGQEGYVIDVNWRNTAIRALQDNMVIIPNATLASEILVNYHRPFPAMSVLAQVGVSYDSDLEHVERVTIEVAREVMEEVDGAVPEHNPLIRFHTFGDSSIDFSVIMRVKEYANQYLVTHEFIKRLHRRYRTEGIEIPFPIRTVIRRTEAPAEVSVGGGEPGG